MTTVITPWAVTQRFDFVLTLDSNLLNQFYNFRVLDATDPIQSLDMAILIYSVVQMIEFASFKILHFSQNMKIIKFYHVVL
jgi:hypothetical protein